MPRKFALKDPGFEYHLGKRRLQIAGAAILLLLLITAARVSYLQIIQHDHFTTLSQSNRVKILPIAPIRGLIFSRDAVLLADNRPSFSLEIVPERAGDITRTLVKLQSIINIDGHDIDRFNELLDRKRRFESVPLRFNLSDEEVARISVNLHALPGVEIRARLNRYYPLGANLAHTVGYVGMIDERELKQLDRSNYSATSHIGKLGVEKAYENVLHGKVGFQQVEVNAQGRIIRVLERTPPTPGGNVYLTLDVSLQNLAVQALTGKRGAIVAMDPGDGAILAMVSSPGYDPNPFVNGIDSDAYQGLIRSSASPLLNRVLQGKYPPGSTIKPFLGIEALATGVRTTSDETWCPGWYSLKGSEHRYRDWKKAGHGHVALPDAIARSCDVYFYALAHDLGIDRVYQAVSRFGFGSITGVDIGGESSGLVPSRAWKERTIGQPWYPGETLILGIGQGSMLATPIQLVVATSAIASRGAVMRPHVLESVRDPISNEVTDHVINEPNSQIKLVDSRHWDVIIDAMQAVVHGPAGTARRIGRGADYVFAGKTGTAQVIGVAQDEEYKVEDIPEELRDHALFIGFAPVRSPRIAVAIVVENGGSGSSGAAPIARLLFDHYLDRVDKTALHPS